MSDCKNCHTTRDLESERCPQCLEPYWPSDLEEGSRWDGSSVVEEDGTVLHLSEIRFRGKKYPALEISPDGVISESFAIWPKNAVALLSANGFIPEIAKLASVAAAASRLLKAIETKTYGAIVDAANALDRVLKEN